MLTLLSGSSVYRLLVTLEINGVPVTVDFHLRVSGGLNWSPYLTPVHHDVLGHYFSTVDRVIYEKFLLSILEVIFYNLVFIFPFYSFFLALFYQQHGYDFSPVG